MATVLRADDAYHKDARSLAGHLATIATFDVDGIARHLLIGHKVVAVAHATRAKLLDKHGWWHEHVHVNAIGGGR